MNMEDKMSIWECMAIADKYAGHFTLEQKLKKLAEEVVELAMSLSRIDMNDVTQRGEAQMELADVLFVLLHINHTQFKFLTVEGLLTAAANKMIDRNSQTELNIVL